jgi:hypothetical protein
MARLEEEVSKQADGQSEGYWFIIGWVFLKIVHFILCKDSK